MVVSRWQELNRTQLNMQLPHSLVVFPTGATEQHGPHLATGHDAITVEQIAHKAAALAKTRVIVAPTVTVGSSGHHLAFGGTLSLSTDTYYRVLREMATSAVRCGATRVFLLNGHGGNHELNQLVVRDLALAETGVTAAAASYWAIADEALRAAMATVDLPFPGHAGYFETSTMLALRPDLVSDREVRDSDPYTANLATIPGVRVERSGSWQVFDGFTDYPHRAEAQVGVRLLAAMYPAVAAAFDAIMA